MDCKTQYKEQIIEMVNEIENIDFLKYIYSFIKPMLKKDKGYSRK